MKHNLLIINRQIQFVVPLASFLSLVISLFPAESAYAVPGAPSSLASVQPQKHLVVDKNHKLSSDLNPGSNELPLKTIQKAIDLAIINRKIGLGTKIRVFPGTYREEVMLAVGRKESDPPIVLEGTKLGKVIISGSDIWSDWDTTNKPNVYVHAWPYSWGQVPFPSSWPSRFDGRPILRRQEMVFVNTLPHRQVLSHKALMPGTFFVSEQEKRIYLYPRTGHSMANSLVEVAVRPSLFKARKKTNLVVRRIVFQHAASQLQKSAVNFSEVKNLLLEDCRVQWNNWVGYQLSEVEHVTSRRNSVNFNGGSGIVGNKVLSLYSENEKTSHNNWRGAQANFYFWAVAGSKYLHIHDALFRGQKSISNQATGFWLDTDNKDILIENSQWCGNFKSGLFIEATQGPITVTNSKIYKNQWIGVHIMTSENTTLKNNYIFDNPGGISVAKTAKRTIKNWETGQLINLETGNWTLRNNVISSDKFPLVVRVRNFVNTLNSHENYWHRHSSLNLGMLEDGQLPRQFITFADWKSVWGKDQSSTLDIPISPSIPSSPTCSYKRIPYWAYPH